MAPAVLPPPAAPWTAAVLAVPQFVALAQAVKDEQAQRLLKHGAKDAYNRLGMQLFIAGLKPLLRMELMKSNPQNMRDAFDAVIVAEKIISEPQKFGQRSIMAMTAKFEDDETDGQAEEEQEDEDNTDAEIAALSAKLKKLKKRSQAKGNKGQKSGQKQANNTNQGKANNQRGGGNKPGACRYCKQEGHFQQECYARKAAGAPLVDAQGQPFRTGGGCMQSMATHNNINSSTNSRTTTLLHIICRQMNKKGG